jgi:hypothetical protein
MSLRPSFGGAFFTGYATPVEPDAQFPVTLAGRSYVIEPKEYRRTYVDDMRPSTDDSNEPTEAAFNPETTWRRGGSSWHLGCGQRDFDLEDQIDLRSRFRSSLNVDVWTRQECRPLPGLTQRSTGAAAVTRPVGAVARTSAGWWAVIDGATKLVTNLGDPAAGVVTALASTPKAASHIVQVGARVYFRFTDSTAGWMPVGGGTLTTVTGLPSMQGLGYAIGRLFAWNDSGGLFELHADASAPTSVMAHPWGAAGWDWEGVVDTPSGGLAWGAGAEGGSELYRLATDDLGAVGPPPFAGSVPIGEHIADVLYLQGMVVLATSLGLRSGSIDQQLTYGPLVPIAGGVHHLCADGRWVLFTWADYDPVSFPDRAGRTGTRYSGLGRIDLSTFTSPLVAAYAPDLMRETDAMVVGCGTDTQANEVVLLYEDGTTWARDRTVFPSTPVFISTGRIRYGAFDPKLFSSVAVRAEPLPDLAALEILAGYDGAEPRHVGDLVGYGAQEANEPFKLPYFPHEWAELHFHFTAGGNPAVCEVPVLLRWILRAVPNPMKAEEIVLPLRLYDTVTLDGDAEWGFDVAGELKWLRQMCESQTPLDYTDGASTVTVYINNIQAGAIRRTLANDAWQGLVTLQLRTVI